MSIEVTHDNSVVVMSNLKKMSYQWLSQTTLKLEEIMKNTITLILTRMRNLWDIQVKTNNRDQILESGDGAWGLSTSSLTWLKPQIQGQPTENALTPPLLRVRKMTKKKQEVWEAKPLGRTTYEESAQMCPVVTGDDEVTVSDTDRSRRPAVRMALVFN